MLLPSAFFVACVVEKEGDDSGMTPVDAVPPILEVAEPVAVVSSSDATLAYVGDAATERVFSSDGTAAVGRDGPGLQALDLLGSDLHLPGVRDGTSALYRPALSGGSP